jgi:hypothetical protein
MDCPIILQDPGLKGAPTTSKTIIGHCLLFLQTNGWYDLMTTEVNAWLTEADKSDKGFKMFLTVHHFLWTYPKNAKTLGSAFSVCKRLVQGDNLWRWVRMIAALKPIKVVWPEGEYNNPQCCFG